MPFSVRGMEGIKYPIITKYPIQALDLHISNSRAMLEEKEVCLCVDLLRVDARGQVCYCSELMPVTEELSQIRTRSICVGVFLFHFCGW